jgi:hypothetical protein
MKRRTLVLWKRILTRFAVVLSLLCIIFLYWGTHFFSIENYDIVGADEIQKEILIKKFKDIEQEKILKIFPGNSIFTYHRRAIRRITLEVLPNSQSISIYPPSFKTLRIIITPYTPLFRKSLTEGITHKGVIYKEIHDIHDLPLLLVASSSQMTGVLLDTIGNIYPKITTSLFPVTSIYVDEYNDVHIKGGTHMSEVIFNADDDVEKVWSTLVSAIDTDPLKGKLISEKDSLKYLDARFGNKVFYRFTNEHGEAIIQNNNATSTATSSSTR